MASAGASAEAERKKNLLPYINHKAGGETILFKTGGAQIELRDDNIYLYSGVQVKFEGIGMAVNTTTGRVIDQNGLKSLIVRKIDNDDIIYIDNKNLDFLFISPTSRGAPQGPPHGGGKRKTSKNKKSKKVKSRKMRK